MNMTSAPWAYSASTLVLPHDTNDGRAPSLCVDGTAPSSCEDSGFMHLHRAAPDDGTTPPSCDADGIVSLRRQKLFLPRYITGGYMASGNPR